MQEAVDLYNMLSDSDTNLRQPIGMASQLLQEGMDSDVAQSMLQLVAVLSTGCQVTETISLCMYLCCGGVLSVMVRQAQ